MPNKLQTLNFFIFMIRIILSILFLLGKLLIMFEECGSTRGAGEIPYKHVFRKDANSSPERIS